MSTIADTHRSARGSRANPFNVRAYLAGSGATTSLVAAAVVAFLTIAALVAFNGLPFGGGGGSGEAQVADLPSGAPEAAAIAIGGGGAPGGVAASAAADSPVPPAPGAEAAASRNSAGATVPGIADPAGPPAGPALGDGASGAGSGALGGTVENLQQTTGGLGLDLPLNDLTQGLTGPVDQTVNKTLNGVGGLLGNPNLGNQVGAGVNNVTGKLLP